MTPKKSIELFAGGGGLALGLEKAGFQHLGLIESNVDAANTLRLNRPNWNVLCDDIQTIAQRDLKTEFHLEEKELDLLSGGAPCQSFSTAGKKLGLEDTRGTMFYYYAQFLIQLKPKVFLFENVKGLRSHDKHRTYQTILSVFEAAGYDTVNAVLNAWDYGAPQRRERLITIGVRRDYGSITDYRYPEPYEYKPVIRDIELEVNPDRSICSRYSDNKMRYMSQVPPGGCWSDIDEADAKEYLKACWFMKGPKTGILRRFSLDEPCFAVMTAPSSKYCDRCHPLEIRPFSYRENARLQTFPDSWEFSGSLSSKYRQIGNAVPVSLAEAIGKSIVHYLELQER